MERERKKRVKTNTDEIAKSTVGERLLGALGARWSADLQEALATIDIYLANPMGVSGHSTHIDEMDKLFSKAIEAKDKMDFLKSLTDTSLEQ